MNSPRISRQVPAVCSLLLALVPSALSEPLITDFTVNGILVWTNVAPGHMYAIERAADPGAPWTNYLDSIQATSSVMTVTVPLEGQQSFFRVVDQGACCTNNAGTSFASATLFGEHCADSGGASQTVYHCGSAWYRLVANECDSSLFAQNDLTLGIYLTPPEGTDYDLYVYYSDGSLLTYSTQGGSREEVVLLTAPDSTCCDDSFEVVIEIRLFRAYPCSDWRLRVTWNY